MRQENLAGRSVVWNTERPSGGEGEGDGRGRFASDVSFLRRAYRFLEFTHFFERRSASHPDK